MIFFFAFTFLTIGGFLFRSSLNKRGERFFFALNAGGIIAVIIFVLITFKGCQELTNPENKPVDERIEIPESN